MVFSSASPPSSQSEFDEFNDITYEKIKSWTDIPKLKRLEKYMREEGFYQTADVARKRIIEQGGIDPENTETCILSSETNDILKALQFWQADVKEKDVELQKLRSSKSKTGSYDLESDVPEVRKVNPENKNKINEDTETNNKSKEGKQIKVVKKDIRSGGEYYRGWDKYVTSWEKENAKEKDMDSTGIHKQDELAEKKNKSIPKEKPLVERVWQANREKEKGNDLFKAKEYNASLQAYSTAIDAYKSSPVIYANRAAVYLKMNRFEEAYADCNEALKLDPQNVKALMRRGKASLEMSKPTMALQDINEVLKFDPTNDEVLCLKRKAEDASNKQNACNPGTKDSNETSLEMGKPTKALKDINEAHSTHEEIISLAEDVSNKQSAACSQSIEGTLPGSRRVLIEEVEGISEMEGKQTQNINHNYLKETKQERIPDIKHEVNGGTYQKENTNQCTFSGSRRVLVEEVVGISETERKQLQSVNYSYVKETNQEIIPEIEREANCGTHQREIKDKGDQKAMSDYWHAKGNKFFKGKNFEKAYDCYTKSLSYASENVLVLSNRALCQLRLKNYIGAEKDASSAITLDSNFVKAFHHRACARHALLKLEEGIEDLKKVLCAFPGDESIISELKKMEDDLNNCRYLPKREGPMLIEEIPYLDNENPSSSNVKTIFQEAKHTSVSFREDEISIIDNQISECQCIEESLTAEEQRMRGNKLFSDGQYKAAIDLYSKSLQLDSSIAATYTNRALCHLKLNDLEKAVDDCNQAIMLEPENRKAYYRRAVSKQQMQDLSGALEDFKILRKLYPNDHIVEKSIQMIETEIHQCAEDKDPNEDVAEKDNTANKRVDVSDLKRSPDISRALENKVIKNVHKIPKTAIEFERSCLDLFREPELLKNYILNIKTSFYPVIFKEDLSARIMKLVGYFLKENMTLFRSEEIMEILEAFTKVKRFKIAILLLPQCDKEVFRQLFESMDETSGNRSQLRCAYLGHK